MPTLHQRLIFVKIDATVYVVDLEVEHYYKLILETQTINLNMYYVQLDQLKAKVYEKNRN